MRRVAAVLGASVMLVACSRTYHPEYHPETSYSFVQNVTYAENALALSPPETSAGSASPWDAPASRALSHESCTKGRPADCWRDCFQKSSGEACYLLSAMFDTGDGVTENHDSARRLSTRACDLGDCGPAELVRPLPPPARNAAPSGDVSSPGAVVVYGNFSGNIYVGR